ncbi:Na+/H+ antiporter subunit E [Georgenia subflava]|uniref:Na+/H+ antiporter subunit E n=1 Tax=Georgenia subflava TaxID=1622177 RepID=A0A6N7EMD0_9MICO|nr:Na+/H+ antiporter subunit E [Georgenia subflava]MPV38288.1 Na+/H+ antiporter subunit E [Georgenia subflava]
MTDRPTTDRAAREEAPDRRRARWPRASWGMIVWLTAVWVLLWGDITWGNALAGLGIALVVTTVAPLPRAPFDGRFRPLGVVRLVAKFAYDVVVASVQISWMALTGRRPHGAVIRVRLRSHSDTFLTATAGFTSLVPGSIVVEAHRLTGTLYIHIFDVRMHGGLDAAHRIVLEQEERIIRAFASRDQLIDAGYVPGSSPRAGRLPGGQTGSRGDAQR